MISSLVHVPIWFVDGERVDISDLKIFWDYRTQQFRHMMYCSTCNDKVGCICYDTLLDAVTDVEEGCRCETCCIVDALCDVSIEEMLNVIEDNDKLTTIVELATSLIGIDKVSYKSTTLRELVQMVIDSGQGDTLRIAIVDIMTQQEKLDICAEYYDGTEACGSFCEKQG